MITGSYIGSYWFIEVLTVKQKLITVNNDRKRLAVRTFHKSWWKGWIDNGLKDVQRLKPCKCSTTVDKDQIWLMKVDKVNRCCILIILFISGGQSSEYVEELINQISAESLQQLNQIYELDHQLFMYNQMRKS